MSAALVLGFATAVHAQAAASSPAGDDPGGIVVTTLPHPATNVLWGRAVGVVDASLPAVTTVVEDYARYASFLPHFNVSRVLSQRGSSALVYLEATIAMGTISLWAQVKLGPVASPDGTRVIEAKLVKGNVHLLEARWELTPLDAGHTQVAFQVLLDFTAPVPASILSNENAKASRKTLKALREAVEKRR